MSCQEKKSFQVRISEEKAKEHCDQGLPATGHWAQSPITERATLPDDVSSQAMGFPRNRCSPCSECAASHSISFLTTQSGLSLHRAHY